MGLAHSPRIVTDGLVLALDAGNVKGYDSKENRILYSEDLTQWGNTSSVDTSNTQIAPNGTQTADEVYATSATVNQGLINRSSNTASTFVQNSWHTFSVHWKAGTSSGFRIQLPWNDGGNAGVFATFVESGGEVSVPTVGGYGNYESGGATVEKLNNGWYRFSITFRPTGVPTGSYVVWLFPSVTSGGDRTTNTTSYIWGAQTEVGQSVTTYVKTEASNKIRGTTLTDLSGNGNNGSLLNGIGYSSDNLGVLSLDGTNDYIDSYDDADVFVDDNSLTVSIFVNIDEPTKTGRGGLVSSQKYQSESDSGGYGLCIYDGTQLCVNLTKDIGGTQTSYQAVSTFTYVRQQFKYYSFTYDNATKTVTTYMDGVQQATSTNANYGWTVNIGNRKTRIGRNWQGGWGNYYNMKIGAVHIHNRALTASEIQQNFNALRGRYGI